MSAQRNRKEVEGQKGRKSRTVQNLHVLVASLFFRVQRLINGQHKFARHRSTPCEKQREGGKLTGIVTMPSNQCPPPTVSTASAIKSLDWSE